MPGAEEIAGGGGSADPPRSSFLLPPSPSDEWALPAGLAPDGVQLLTLREIADGAREVPLGQIAAADRKRIVAARAEAVGARRKRSLDECEWIALGFVRELLLAGRRKFEEVGASPMDGVTPTEPAGRIVVGDARWDEFARAARAWRRERLYPQLAEVDLLDEACLSRTALQVALGREQPRALSLSGHGRADALFGDAFELLLSADPQRPRLPAELRGVVVHLLACKCAQRLGPALVAAGAAAFIGYDDDFLYDVDAPEDFFECDAEIVRALASGLAAEDAVERARRRGARAVARLRAEAEPYRAAMLQFNLEHLRSICPQR